MHNRLIAAFLAAVTYLALIAPPASAAQPMIVGGTDADQAYPFIVSLHGASGKFFCAGSLIAPTWVLTAAHCVVEKNPAVLSVRIGSNDNTQGGEVAQPAEIVIDPKYDPDGAGADIALIRLTSPVKTAPIAIGTVTAPGTATRLLGWGQTCPEQGCGKSPAILQQLDTQIVDGKGCTATFDGKLELCTESPGGKAGSCYGDSGGPELAKVGDEWRLLGITSRPGSVDVTCTVAPSIYTSAPAHAEWIASYLTPTPTPTPPPPVP